MTFTNTIKMFMYVFYLGYFLNPVDYGAYKIAWDNKDYIMEKLKSRPLS